MISEAFYFPKFEDALILIETLISFDLHFCFFCQMFEHLFSIFISFVKCLIDCGGV